MPRFTFKLEQVLRYREQLEDQAKLALTRCLAEYNACLARKKEIETELASVESKLFDGANAFFQSPGERWLLGNYCMGLKSDLHVLAQKTNSCEIAVHQARSKLLRCSQDRQLLDKLKEKQMERHNHEEKLREQRELDELTTTRRNISTF